MNLVAKDLMTSPVVSVSETTTVKELVALMSERAISGVPVVDEGGVLVGVISITDLLAANLGDDDFGHADFHTSPSMDGLTELHDLLAPGEDIEEHQVSQLMSQVRSVCSVLPAQLYLLSSAKHVSLRSTSGQASKQNSGFQTW